MNPGLTPDRIRVRTDRFNTRCLKRVPTKPMIIAASRDRRSAGTTPTIPPIGQDVPVHTRMIPS